jgi:hypothetical protein
MKTPVPGKPGNFPGVLKLNYTKEIPDGRFSVPGP